MDSPKTVLSNVLEYSGCKNYSELAKIINVGAQGLRDIANEKSSKASGKPIGISRNLADAIVAVYENVNINYLLTGAGTLLSDHPKTKLSVLKGDNMIPLFEDVNTIGGFNLESSGVGIQNQASEYINAGGWFKGATAAIRHYNDSMREYPSGCILALKEMVEIDFIWGTNYCIEYGEDFSRVTKRVQRGDAKDEIKAYSTNTETYPDGRMIHEPLDIKVHRIKRLFQVLGVVIKERSIAGDMAIL